MMESANVRIDEFTNNKDKERKKLPNDYNKFIYVYEDTPSVVLKLQHRAIK